MDGDTAVLAVLNRQACGVALIAMAVAVSPETPAAVMVRVVGAARQTVGLRPPHWVRSTYAARTSSSAAALDSVSMVTSPSFMRSRIMQPMHNLQSSRQYSFFPVLTAVVANHCCSPFAPETLC